jgi:LuxR family maltose regulon positive regulatory protein
MFIVPLDVEHQWFRYHHLFQNLLATQLRQERTPEEITALHLRASGWFERNRLIEESIAHALKAANAERATGIIERHRWDELNRDRWYVVQRWLRMLPPATEHRPELLFAEAWIHYERYQLGKIPPLLERITALLDGGTEQPALWGEMYFFRGALAFFEGNGESGKQFFEHARELLPRGENLIWGLLELLDALSRYTTGEKEPAVEALERRIQEATSHNTQFFSRLIAGLFFLYYLMGDLHRARAYAQRLRSVATSGQIAYTEAWSSYMQACTYLHAHELDQALRHFNAAFAQRYILHVRAAVDVIGGLSLTHQLMGQTDAATATMERLIEFAREMEEPVYLTVATSYRARLSLLQGNLEPAMEWAASASGRATPLDLFIWLENPFTTLARVWIAESSPENLEKATHLLEGLREQSEACQYTCQAIEIAVLQSLACENQGETDKALTLLEGVVEQAVSLGWFRPFVEAGPPMAGLLRRLERRGAAGVDLGTLLDACTADREQVQGSASEGRRAMVIAPSHGPTMPETEALTEREIEVVSLLAEGLTNREIASRLFLSPSTVKAHVYNIYQKWDVHSRVSAVDKAKKTGLID